MTRFFDFSTEEMTRAPIWVRFPNLPLCYWSPICLFKIVSVIGKPIQCDHMTSTLSRLSYACVLVEIDLRENLQQSVMISLPSGQVLHQKVVYESLPKFYNFCNVIGHTKLLCSKAMNNVQLETSAQAMQVNPKGVFSRLGPQP